MIHLDTNYLIGLPVKGSAVALDVDGWLAAEESLAVSRAEAVLQSRIIPFSQAEAALAAGLFNKTGRRRGSRFDCLIALTHQVKLRGAGQ